MFLCDWTCQQTSLHTSTCPAVPCPKSELLKTDENLPQLACRCAGDIMFQWLPRTLTNSTARLVCLIAGLVVLIFTLIQYKVISGAGGAFSLASSVRKHSWQFPKNDKPKTKISDMNTIKERFLERKYMLDKGCASHTGQIKGQKTFDRGDYLAINGTAVYCPIEKTASITWRGIFAHIQSRGVRVDTVGYYMSIPLDTAGLNSNRNSRVRFIFVREPYGRHVSAYVDKLFSPNIEFWRSFGHHIIRKFRPNADARSRACGHDVTFAEYVKYVINAEKTGDHRDGHFLPQHQHCHACGFPYNYVGHLETMEEDTEFLLKAIHSPVEYTQDYAMFTMEDQVRWYFGDRQRYGHCMTLEEAMRRYWKKLQIRGLVHKHIGFPFTAEQCRALTVQDLIQAGRQAVLTSRGLGSAMGNKREALVEAFRSVSAGDKEELRRLYWRDFELFGYDPSPEYIFGNQTEDFLKYNNTEFSYFSVWD